MAEFRMSVQKNAVVDLRHQINEMTRSIQTFSNSMKNLYSHDNDTSFKVNKLRDETREDAMVCLKDILPLSTMFVSSVTDYFDYYETLEYKQWRQLIPDILEKARGYRELSEKIRQKYEESLVRLKARQDKARQIQAEMTDLKEDYEKRKREFQNVASTKRSWAIGLAFVPIVNLFATPALLDSAGKDDYEAGWNGTQENKMERAAIKIGQTLIPALEAFINGLAKAAGFFSVTEQEIFKFQGNAEKGMEEQKFLHYKLMKTEAQEIKSLCQAFKEVLPKVNDDLSALKGNAQADPLKALLKLLFSGRLDSLQ
ncbi:uncharacterized protein LOC114961580 isoform X2 [Acropora millepora]|uniref:uncharacterized protein LOC114961584 n=1 Tax=Acropora millepora TaxID=45264 RepID=UPI001CF11BA1|nr:uncharacterized protein LOC114961584 [Acropora millepora]XP_044163696.1 uncharacterized protein LOC114961580 isoform X2 [Acropora millepora]